jgi:hypothetical protein
MISPCYTKDKSQAERCKTACKDRTTITEVFDTITGTITVTGQVQTVVEHPDATPKNWSITFGEGARAKAARKPNR